MLRNWRHLPVLTFLLLLVILAVATQPVLAGPLAAQASPVATVSTGGTARLNFRSGPGLSFPVVGQLANGTSHPALGRDVSGQWLLLALPDLDPQAGWVSARYATLNIPISQLPVRQPAAAPHARAVQPQDRGLAGRIAFPAFDPGDGTYAIYLVDGDGSNLRRVVAEASQPSLSPDGSRLAFRHWKPDDRGIVVLDTASGKALRVSDFLEDGLPAWSPDGTKLIFSSYREVDRNSRIYYLWADRKRDWVLTRGPEAVYGADPYWMPDGRVVYQVGRPTQELATMSSDGSAAVTLLSDATARGPSASPDGRQIAFMSQRDGNWEIYRINADGSNLQRLTRDPANDGLPTWSPDGGSVAFVSDRGGRWRIWVMRPDGSDQRPLVDVPGSLDGQVRFEPEYLNRGWLEEQISWSR